MEKNEKLIRSVLGQGAESFDYEVAGKKHLGWRAYLRRKGEPYEEATEMVERSWRKLFAGGIHLFVGPGRFEVASGQYADSWGEVEFDPADAPPIFDRWAKSPPTVDQVIALPDVSVLDVIEFCRVGSHNDDGVALLSLEDIEAAGDSLPPEFRAAAESLLKHEGQNLGRQIPVPVERWVRVQEVMAKIAKIAPFAIQFADAAGLRATFLKKIANLQATKIAPLILFINDEAMEVMAGELAIKDDDGDPLVMIANYLTTKGQIRLWWD